jgi:deazaflavin-dependent oxidoreductase (nitroreductase family)
MGLQSTFLRFHQALYEGTRGWLGHRTIGVPCLMLRTTGRRSGQPRTAALVYARDDGSYVVVASNGGADRPPGWLHNVKAKPQVDIQVGRRSMPATATIVERGDADYERLWTAVNANNHGRYDGYQRKTDRPISLVVLSPDAG